MGPPFFTLYEERMTKSKVAIIILAAGLGTRMKSDKAKVLHAVCGKPMIWHVLNTAARVAGSNVVVVVGHQAEKVKALIGDAFDAGFALQAEQLGTGHAAQCAMPHLPDDVEEVVILCGDVPLIRAETIEHLIAEHLAHERDVTLLAVDIDTPRGYGRVLRGQGGELHAIVEEADADDAQKEIKTINTGIYAAKRSFLLWALPQIEADNTPGEFYLTDIIGIGHRQGKSMGVVMGDDDGEVIGVNSLSDLQIAENTMKRRAGKFS